MHHGLLFSSLWLAVNALSINPRQPITPSFGSREPTAPAEDYELSHSFLTPSGRTIEVYGAYVNKTGPPISRRDLPLSWNASTSAWNSTRRITSLNKRSSTLSCADYNTCYGGAAGTYTYSRLHASASNSFCIENANSVWHFLTDNSYANIRLALSGVVLGIVVTVLSQGVPIYQNIVVDPQPIAPLDFETLLHYGGIPTAPWGTDPSVLRDVCLPEYVKHIPTVESGTEAAVASAITSMGFEGCVMFISNTLNNDNIPGLGVSATVVPGNSAHPNYYFPDFAVRQYYSTSPGVWGDQCTIPGFAVSYVNPS